VGKQIYLFPEIKAEPLKCLAAIGNGHTIPC
jgi:hypothetical protein